LLYIISFASATTIFSDGFESGNLNGWELSNAQFANPWNISSINPPFGNWNARAEPLNSSIEPASVMQKNASTAGYQNITLSYSRRLAGLDISDEFKVKWFDGNNWVVVEETSNLTVTNTSWIFKSFNLSVLAINNSNFKISFECTANSAGEDCRVDNVLLEGDVINQASGSYYGYFHYMPSRDYYVLINTSNNLISFSGLNISNQNEFHIGTFDSQGRFSVRKNYVWFNGWFNSTNLYVNQYVDTGVTHAANTFQQSFGVYSAFVIFPNLPYLGINTPIFANVLFDVNTNQATFTPVLYPQIATLSLIDPVWNASGHAFGPMLFQTKLAYNGTGYGVAVEEWVKEDLAYNGLAPRWNVPLQIY